MARHTSAREVLYNPHESPRISQTRQPYSAKRRATDKRYFLTQALITLMRKPIDAALLGALRCFATAARLLSFTRAADALSLTQSAISQQIRQLEKRLGYALFVRGHRSLTLTREGEMLLEGTQRAFDEIETTLVRIASTDEPVRVGCCPSFALHWLVSRLPDFHQHFERNPVQLNAEFTAVGMPDDDTTGVDVAIRYSVDDFPLTDVHALLLDEWLLPVATPTYLQRNPAAAKGRIDKSCVLLHDAAAWTGADASAEWRAWMTAVQPAAIRHVDGPHFNLASMAFSAALNHQGVAIARVSLLTNELRDGRLVPVVPVAVRSPASYWMISRSANSPAASVFNAWLLQECRQFARRRAVDIGKLGIARPADAML